jgi:biopolymer transport protein ExbB
VNFESLHRLTFDLLYACLALLTFVIAERSFFFGYLGMRAQKIAAALRAPGFDPAAWRAGGGDVLNRSVAEYIGFQLAGGTARPKIEDLSSALFLEVDGKVQARLWILDTVVTAAPLLGLLGTVLGIMDTFTSLAQSGISDPAAVSRGIGTALIATAIGIATALYGLVGHSVLNRQAVNLIEMFKSFMLRTTL